jgi:tRNA G26 N,N-dimethylase Trm1
LDAAAQDLSEIPYYFTVDEVAKMLKRNPHSVLQTVEVLRAVGFQASVTPLNSAGFKTNAGLGEILRLLR